jgi:hypothetical protein
MESRDGLFRHLDGVGCTVCGKPIDGGRIRLLAQREEHAFVELECVACGTTTIGIVTIDDEDPDAAHLDTAPFGEFGPADEARLRAGTAFDTDDVLAMHDFLAGYRGDLRGLVGRPREDRGGGYA